MAGRPGNAIVQEASLSLQALYNSSAQTGKNDRKAGRAKRAALIGDDQRTLTIYRARIARPVSLWERFNAAHFKERREMMTRALCKARRETLCGPDD